MGEPGLNTLQAKVLGADGSKMKVFVYFDATFTVKEQSTVAKVIILSRDIGLLSKKVLEEQKFAKWTVVNSVEISFLNMGPLQRSYPKLFSREVGRCRLSR